jgi:hypothetical protein
MDQEIGSITPKVWRAPATVGLLYRCRAGDSLCHAALVGDVGYVEMLLLQRPRGWWIAALVLSEQCRAVTNHCGLIWGGINRCVVVGGRAT